MRHKKPSLATILLLILSLLSLLSIIFYLPPEKTLSFNLLNYKITVPFSFILFFTTFFFFTTSLLKIIIKSTSKSIGLGFTLTIFTILKTLDLLHWLNLLLLSGLLISSLFL